MREARRGNRAGATSTTESLPRAYAHTARGPFLALPQGDGLNSGQGAPRADTTFAIICFNIHATVRRASLEGLRTWYEHNVQRARARATHRPASSAEDGGGAGAARALVDGVAVRRVEPLRLLRSEACMRVL